MFQPLLRWFGRPVPALALLLTSLLVGWQGFDLAYDLALGERGFPDLRFSVNQRTTQYFFAYQDFGFIKRGLMGTLLHPFPALLTRVGLAAVCACLLVAFAVAFWRFLFAATDRLDPAARGVLVLVSALMPAFFLRLGWDFGRFDVIDLLAALACLALLLRGAWFRASLPAAAALLVHEDFLFFAVPLIAALAWRQGARLRELATLFALPAAAGLALAIGGRAALPLPALLDHFAHDIRYLAATPDGQVNEEEVSVISRTLHDNFSLAGQMFVQKRAVFHLAVIAVWFAFVCAFAAGFYRRNGRRADLLLGAAFAPLLLGIVAFDYYRWVAMAAVNVLLVILLRCRELLRAGRQPVVVWDVSATVLACSAVLGPICNTKSFLYPYLLLDRIWPGRIPW